jgi:hypothetical protein
VQKQSSDTDPMARVVDRLLAQLAGTPTGPRNRWAPTRNGHATRGPAVAVVVGSARHEQDGRSSSSRELIGLWTRVLLALALGGLMTQWPYSHDCGVRLFGYVGAVASVVVAGSWIAFVSWRRRNGYAHVLALILVFWGMVLAAEQLLPRIGYAAETAVWQCDGKGLLP